MQGPEFKLQYHEERRGRRRRRRTRRLFLR
jgi:hypothetical protein